MLPIPTKIRAVREDPAAPLVECYPETPDALAAIFAARSTPTTPTEFAKPLKTICAHSDGKQLRDVLQVNVYKLDKALKATDATIEMRLAFKASLDRFGLLTVPR